MKYPNLTYYRFSVCPLIIHTKKIISKSMRNFLNNLYEDQFHELPLKYMYMGDHPGSEVACFQ
jgi:hypothetical protein